MNLAPRAADIDRFRELVAHQLGLEFDGCRLGQLEETLARRTESSGTSAASYLDRLQNPQTGVEEMRSLATELTVAETYFFRNNDQFRAFSELVLPEVMRARSNERRVRILSAGCASGEEAYTLAILVSGLTTDDWDISIRGIDVSPAALERATLGRYSTWSLRETPGDVRGRWFRPVGRDFLLDPALRARASFSERNLTVDDGAFWAEGSFDVVFCRNVLMYFSPDTAKAVVARLARSLVPGGFLFLGHAETLRGVSQDFHLRHTHEAFYYQRRLPSEELAHEAVPATPTPAAMVFSPALLDDTWMDAIRHASEHVRVLTGPAAGQRGSATANTSAGSAKAAWNLAAAADLVGREHFSEARSLLEALPAESTHDPDVLLLKAVLLTHGGDLIQAEEVCRQLLVLDELSAGAHYLTALCREDAGDTEGAFHHDQVATYLDPNFAMPRLHLGLLARRAARPDTARRELQHALLLLEREEASRLLLFGGGFSRDALAAVCRAELLSCGGPA